MIVLSKKPSIAAAYACAFFGVLYIGTIEIIRSGLHLRFLWVLPIAFIMYWALGFLFSSLSLLILKPVNRLIPRMISLLVFALVGFLIPAIPMYLLIGLAHMNHGNVEVIFVGSIGLGSAVTAWWALNEKGNDN